MTATPVLDFNNAQTSFHLGTRYTRVWAWEGGSRHAASNDDAVQALFELATIYLFDTPEIPADGAKADSVNIAPSIHATIRRRTFAAEKSWKSVFASEEESGVSKAEDDASWEDQIHRVHEAIHALEDANVMAQWIKSVNRNDLTAIAAIEELPGFDKILDREDGRTALNLLFRYMNSLVDYDLIVNMNGVDKTVLRPND